MAYPIPENVTGIYDLGTYTNSVTTGFFGPGFLITLFVIMFLRFHGFRDTPSALLGASFMTFMIGTFFRLFGWINDLTFYIIIVVLIGSILIKKIAE